MRSPKPASKAEPGEPRQAKPAALPDELAAAVEVAIAGIPGSTAAPFVTVVQMESERRERRRRLVLRVALLALVALATFSVLHLAVTRMLFRTPGEEALEDYVRAVGVEIVPLYSSARQPLQLSGSSLTLVERIDSNQLRYAVELTLQLRQPLYAPANTNGTVLYRQLQQSLHVARIRDLKYNLLEPGTQAPELPLLVQLTHRAGEKLVVRMPFEAKRFGWTWRIAPPQLFRRVANRTFEGDVIERYAKVPHIIFGQREAMAEIRRRMQQARTYIIAVTREVQKHADAVAIVESSEVDPSLADVPAFEEELAGFDPNAPALDPDAQAVDPDAAAVNLDDAAAAPEPPPRFPLAPARPHPRT